MAFVPEDPDLSSVCVWQNDYSAGFLEKCADGFPSDAAAMESMDPF